jgi:hypothetical protein
MFSFNSLSAHYSGKIVEVKTHADPYISNGSPWSGMAWLTIEGVNVNSDCKVQAWSNGLTPFYFSSESSLLSFALAAKLADKRVKVYVSKETQLVNGVCKLEFIGL